HGETVEGVFRELCNAFVRSKRQPSVPQMWSIYRVLQANLQDILNQTGNREPFNARVFKELCVLASAVADQLI
ncbi:MAG TPA: hypothetical protein VGR50_04120, partial [Terriglobales bacterium]|nr:hypothetical protein [Terriglobales bacterium]